MRGLSNPMNFCWMSPIRPTLAPSRCPRSTYTPPLQLAPPLSAPVGCSPPSLINDSNVVVGPPISPIPDVSPLRRNLQRCVSSYSIYLIYYIHYVCTHHIWHADVFANMDETIFMSSLICCNVNSKIYDVLRPDSQQKSYSCIFFVLFRFLSLDIKLTIYSFNWSVIGFYEICVKRRSVCISLKKNVCNGQCITYY